MDTLGKKEIRDLLGQAEDTCVSIYMKTDIRSPEGWEKSRIRLKNLLSGAETELNGIMRTPEVNALLAPAYQLIESGRFEKTNGNGLALFLGKGFFRKYNAADAFDDFFMVGERFYVKPLLPALGPNGRFYLLALSQNEIQLFAGTRHTIQQVEVESLPTSLAEAMKFDDPERELQYHTGSAPAVNQRAAMFHGHAVEDDEKEFIRQYFRQVNKGLHNYLKDNDKDVPLVLAGVEYLFSIYRDANTYPNLLDGGIPGNPEERSQAELQQKAWELVQPFYDEVEVEARQRYQDLAGTDRTSDDLAEIVRAAHHGRIDTLFIKIDKNRWGHFDMETNQVEIHEEPSKGDAELFDLVAAQTIAHDGLIIPIETDDYDENAPLTAVFRY